MEHVKFNLRYCKFQFVNNFVMELYELPRNYADEGRTTPWKREPSRGQGLAPWRQISRWRKERASSPDPKPVFWQQLVIRY